ncbi:MAG: lactonase family protein [Clostridia bacterium]|nr:lactonase family protein [Clostridia bacterium]
MTHNQRFNIYIASCTKDGGIYQYEFSDSSEPKLINFTPMDRPMYMTRSDNKMHILLRAPFEDRSESGVVVYDIDSDGKLTNPGEVLSTGGDVACHLAVDGDNTYCVNYISGSVIKMPSRLVFHTGKGVNVKRQEGPHTHFVGFTPDNKYLCVTDLGLDTIFIYDKDLNLINKAQVPVGHGARHLIFSDDGKYCFVANELESTVSVFSYSEATLTLIDTKKCLPSDFERESTASAIRYEKGLIYVSNRGHDSISQMSFDGEKLELQRTISCFGKTPRDFMMIGDCIISTNQDSDDVTFIEMSVGGDDALKNRIEIPAPICVIT